MTPARPSKPKQPTVAVIAGPNGAGKSTAAPYRWRVLNNASGTLTSIAHGTARRIFIEDSNKWLNLQHLGQ